MNFNNVTLIFIICHFLADFQFQSEELSFNKLNYNKGLNKHIIIHCLVLLYPLILGCIRGGLKVMLFSIMIILGSHFLIDFIKIKFTKKYLMKGFKTNKERNSKFHSNTNIECISFLVDQLIHIAIIIFLGEFVFKTYFSNINPIIITKMNLIYILSLVLVTKPANVLFKVAFKKYGMENEYTHNNELNDEKVNADTQMGAGALIGDLERILSVIFLVMGQSSAIGLIYTAKSIARFKQIEDNKRFAEYYLIGTLYSILYAIIVYLVLLK